jgi:ATP dependent DNA ligase domain
MIPECRKGLGCRHVCTTLREFTEECYVEVKYDGWRMQIHVDLSLPEEKQIRIYSKDRNDSTKDRREILPYKKLGRGLM